MIPLFKTIVNYDKENGWSSIFNSFVKSIPEASQKTKEFFDLLALDPDVKLWNNEELINFAKSCDVSETSVIDFLSNVKTGEATLSNYQSYLQSTAKQTTTFATITQKAGSALKTIGGAFLSTFANMAVMYAASVAIEAIGTAIYNTIHASEIANEKMENSFSAYQNAQSDVQSVNEELLTTQSRINELNAKGSLTFLEQSELNKLKEANESLQLQADLKEKAAKKQAKESAKDTVAGYEKNYGKYEVSESKVKEYEKNAQSKGNNLILLSNENDISAMIAGIHQFNKIRDEALSSGDTEDVDYYNEMIETSTQSIWDQVTALEKYKSNLEDVKSEYGLSDAQQSILDNINNSIEYIYSQLDPEKWKQIQFDKVFNQARFSGFKDELINIAKATDNVGISAEQVENKYPRLVSAMKDVGVTAQDIADNINSEAGVLNLDEIKKQLSEDFMPEMPDGDLGFQILIDKAQSEWNNFTKDMSNNDFEILYSIKQSNDTSEWNIEDWKNAFDVAKQSAEELSNTPISFSSLFASDEEGSFNKTIDAFQSNISTIDSALETLRNGEDIDLTDLTQQFPELTKESGNLQESLSNLKAKQIGDFVSQWKEFTKELNPSEMKYAQNFMKNFLSSMDFTGTDLSSVRSKILSALMPNPGELDSVGRQQVYDMVDGWMSAIEQKLNSFDTFIEKSSTLISQINTINSILNSQSTGKSISIEDFNSDELKDYTSALEYNNGALQLNAEKVQELQKAKAEEAIQTNENQKLEKQNQYMENIAEIEKLQDELRNLNNAKGENAQAIQSSIDALLSENDTIVNQCSQLDILSASLREATGAYQNWLDKQNGSESGDMFDDAMGALDHIEDVTQNTKSDDYGRIGKKSYKAAVEFLVPDTIDSQDAEAVSSYIDSIEHYFNHDSDGNRTGLDVAEFCAKATKAGLMELDEATNEYKILGQRTMQDFADGLNLSLPMVQAMFGEMEEFGGQFDWADEAIKTLGDLGMAAGEAKDRLESIDGNQDLNIQIDVSDIETTEDKISTLENTISEMQEYKTTLAVDSSEVEDANAIIQYCITQKQMLEAPTVMTIDASQVNGEIGNALSLLQQFQEAKNNVELQAEVGADTSEAQGQVDSLVSEIQSLSPEIKAQLGIDGASEATITASIQGITPEILVKAGVDSALVDAYAAEEKQSKGTVTWDNQTGAVDAWASQMHVSKGTVSWGNDISQVKTYFTATGHVNWENSTPPSGGVHGLNGTAHASGTAHYPHLVGHANAKGNWGAKTGGMTLVGELGREIVVNPFTGTWETVGDNGAEFRYIPAGSIVFNHLQAESLLERGFVNSRGSAKASGTAMVSGGISVKQANIASGNTTYKGSTSTKSNTTATKQNTSAVNTNTKAVKQSSQAFDWIRVALDRAKSKVEEIAATITDFVSSAYKSAQLQKKITAIDNEIVANQKGYSAYLEKANAVAKKYVYQDDNDNTRSLSIPSKYKKLVQNGTFSVEDIDTSTAYGKALAEAVQKYQEYYEAAQDCRRAVQDLRTEQYEAFQELMNIPTEEAEKKIDKLERKLKSLTAVQSTASIGSSAITKLQKLIHYYTPDANTTATTLEQRTLANAQMGQASYIYQNDLLDQQISIAKSENYARQTALNKATKNAENAQKNYTQQEAKIQKQATTLLKNKSVTKALNATQKAALKAGKTISTTGITDPAVLKKIKAYNDMVKQGTVLNTRYTIALEAQSEAVANAAEAEAEYAQIIIESEKQKFENIQSYYNTISDYNQKLSESYQGDRELKSAKGQDLSEDDYQKEIESRKKDRQILIEQETALQEQLDSAVKSRRIIKGSDEWLEMASQIRNVHNEAQNLEITIMDLQDTMREDVFFQAISKALDKAEALRASLGSISDLISDDMKFDDDGRLTDLGITSLAMDIKDYESYLDSMQTLIKKRNEYIKQFNNGNNDTNYSQKEFEDDMQKVSDDIRSLLSQTNNARKSIIDSIVSQSKAEFDAINKVIDARQNLMKKQKEYYDYDKTLKSKTRDVQLLEQQIAALYGVNDAESKAKKAQLEAQLKEAKDNLNDTVFEHRYEMQITGLDDLKTELQDNYDNYVKDLNSNLETIVSAVDTSTANINNCLNTVNDTITKLLDSFNIDGLSGEVVGIPSYASGTKNAKGGLSRVNDGNGDEIVILKDGSVLMPLTKGSQVLSARETADQIAFSSINKAMPTYKVPEINMPKMSQKEPTTISPVIQCPITINGNADGQDIAKELNKRMPEITKQVSVGIYKDLKKNGY